MKDTNTSNDVGLIREVSSSIEANNLLGLGWRYLGFYTKPWDSRPDAQQMPMYVMGKPE